MLERLTYLLGIVVAIIGWATTQLSDASSKDKALVYDLYENSLKEEKIIHLMIKNISRSEAIETVSLKIRTDDAKCKLRTTYKPIGMSVDANSPNETDASFQTEIPFILPGSELKFESIVNKSCSFDMMIDPNDKKIRIIESGLESYIIDNRFGIYTALLASFSLVFLVTFGVSCLITLRGGN